jgi:hypothetical protein
MTSHDEIAKDIKKLLQFQAKTEEKQIWVKDSLVNLKAGQDRLETKVDNMAARLVIVEERSPGKRMFGIGSAAGLIAGSVTGFFSHYIGIGTPNG